MKKAGESSPFQRSNEEPTHYWWIEKNQKVAGQKRRATFLCFIFDNSSSRRHCDTITHRRLIEESMPAKRIPRPPLEKLFQIKVSLVDSPLPIWRRLQIPSGVQLDVVHQIFQIALGWTNSHLHEFEANDTRYGQTEFGEDDSEMLDEREFCLINLLAIVGDTAHYRYDFGDGWEHNILLEKVTPYDPKAMLLDRCLAGKRACPPEDVGGTDGYRRFINSIEDPESEERKEFLEWIGSDFNPDSFDARLVNFQFQVIEQTLNERFDEIKKAAAADKRKKKSS